MKIRPVMDNGIVTGFHGYGNGQGVLWLNDKCVL